MSRLARLIPLAVATAGLAAIAGCSSGQTVDFQNGRALFTEKCGTCHALAEAGSTAQVGPDLDAVFTNARAEGMDSDTIEGVVAAQIENPRTYPPELVSLYMPAKLVEGDDAADVAHYVSEVAGVPGIGPPTVPGFEDVPGAQVFANNGCGSCHTLEGFPGATGTLGPDLSETLPGQTPAEIEEDIVDPSAEIVQGFDDAMPSDYGDVIPAPDLQALVEFLVDQTGGGSSSAGSEATSGGSGEGAPGGSGGAGAGASGGSGG